VTDLNITAAQLARRIADLNITAAQLACLRRIANGEPVGKFRGSLGYLYLHDLVQGTSALTRATNTLVLTDMGRALLATHDALPETRKVERPRLVSLPVPNGWHLYCLHEGDAAVLRSDCWTWLIKPCRFTATALREQRAVLAAMEWSVHEAAVKAQDEVKP